MAGKMTPSMISRYGTIRGTFAYETGPLTGSLSAAALAPQWKSPRVRSLTYSESHNVEKPPNAPRSAGTPSHEYRRTFDAKPTQAGGARHFQKPEVPCLRSGGPNPPQACFNWPFIPNPYRRISIGNFSCFAKTSMLNANSRIESSTLFPVVSMISRFKASACPRR
jgi:hypothetical protein